MLTRESLKNLLSELSDREAKILELKYGLLDGKTTTNEEIAKEFGCEEKEIEADLDKAFTKFRHPNRITRLSGEQKPNIV